MDTLANQAWALKEELYQSQGHIDPAQSARIAGRIDGLQGALTMEIGDGN